MSHFPLFQLAGRNIERMIALDEFFGCISPRSLKYFIHTSRVNIDQFGYIVDVVLDYYPNVIFGIVFCHIFPTIKYLFSTLHFLFDLHMFLCFAEHIFTMFLWLLRMFALFFWSLFCLQRLLFLGLFTWFLFDDVLSILFLNLLCMLGLMLFCHANYYSIMLIVKLSILI